MAKAKKANAGFTRLVRTPAGIPEGSLGFATFSEMDLNPNLRYSQRNRNVPDSQRRTDPYPQPNVGNINDIKFTDEEVGALARAIPNLFKKWELKDCEARKLLGGISQEEWDLWKNNADAVNIDDQDLKMRMAHLMGIHAGLLTIFNEPETGYAWIKGADENFGGKTALQVMLDGKIASIRKWIETEIRI